MARNNMPSNSSIEWTDSTWNPVRGCTKGQPGFKHCYAERFAECFRGVSRHPFEQGFDLRLVPEKLEEPLKWKAPKRVFVNSMSDLFHDEVPFQYILQVFSVMNHADWHQYQILTKRADRIEALNSKLQWSPHIWMGVGIESDKYLYRIGAPVFTDWNTRSPGLSDLTALYRLCPLPARTTISIDFSFWIRSIT
jgi:protein gp37